MNDIKISPSILSADFSKLGKEIQDLEKAKADLIHIDVMDGHFVPNITIGPEVIKKLRKYTSLPFDVHLMISPVDNFIKNFAEAGSDIITIHPEATNDLKNSIKKIKSFKKKVGISLNPETSLDKVLPVLNLIDLGDMLKMPYKNDTFDVLFAGWVIAYTDRVKEAINEFIRVSKNGSVICIGISHKPDIQLSKVPLKSSDEIISYFGENLNEVYFKFHPNDPKFIKKEYSIIKSKKKLFLLIYLD